MGLKLDGYIRVSRLLGREGEGYIAPKVQQEAIERYAANLGGEIVGPVANTVCGRRSHGYIGTTPRPERVGDLPLGCSSHSRRRS